jgi:hypothetical protein
MLERIVRHCLEKDPAARFQSARDIAFNLEALSTISSSAPATAVQTRKARRTWLVPALLGAVPPLLLVAGLLIGRLSAPPPVPPQYHQLTFARESISSARLAPDQHTAIYSWEMLVIQQRRQLEAYAWVGVLARAPLTGAAPRPVLNDVQDADWGPEDRIAVAHFVGERFRLEYPVGH